MSFKSKYLVVSTDFSIPSKHHEETPDDSKPVPRWVIDPWYEVCLNCSLVECYQDGDRDDNYGHQNNRTEATRQLKEKKKLCPIEIAKKEL